MKLQTYFLGLTAAGLLLARPAAGLAQDELPGEINDRASSMIEQQPGEFSTEEGLAEFPIDQSAQSEDQAEAFDVVEVAFCYAGTGIDPSTGETVDLYSLCSDDLERA
jgi:hypothetical protein